MERTKIKEALEKAQLIVASHGMVNYMPTHAKAALTQPINEYNDRISFDFFLNPKRAGYSSDNYTCSISVLYAYHSDVERDGGIYRDHTSRVSLRLGGGDVSLEQLEQRENMIQSLKMLMEMIAVSIPKSFVETVMTPDALKEKRQLQHEQTVASRIFDAVGKDAIKNLRTNGKPKVSLIPANYAETHGEMPEQGRYRFDHVKAVNRRGQVRDRAGFIFVVKKTDERYILRAFRVS